MDHKQRFQRRMLELHRSLIRMERPFQRRTLVLHRMDRKIQRHSLVLNGKRAYPSGYKAYPSSPSRPKGLVCEVHSMGFQRHSLELRMGKQFLLRSLVQRHSLIHKEQRFQRHSLGQRHNLIRMEQRFQRRTMDQQPMYHSKS